MSARFTAAEAAEILRDLARGREDGSGVDVWPLYERAEDAMAEVVALAVDRDAQRARADAAEEALTRLRSKHAAVYRQATHDRELRVAAEEALTTAREERDAARAEAAGLRAVVEGRTVPPTPQEIAAHHDASGSGWLVSSDRDVIPYTLCRSEARDGGAPDGARWWPLDASGRPCDWPAVAAEAATGAALAGEGRTTERAECRCGHPVEMHRGADRCGAYGCGCDLSAEEAGWS